MELYKQVTESLDGKEELLSAEYCSKISMLDGKIAEDIYLLILYYYVENGKSNKDNLIEGKEFPYSSKLVTKEGKGLNFKVSQIPEELQKIIFRYLRLVSY